MEEKAEIYRKLSNILNQVMDQYWGALNTANEVEERQFEKLCELGCNLKQVLDDFQAELAEIR